MIATTTEYVILAAVLALTPGADTMLVLKNSIRGGFRDGALTVLGVKMGTLVHATMAGLGVAAIMLQAPIVFEVLKMCGAGYLIYLGLQSIVGSFRNQVRRDEEAIVNEKLNATRSLREGFLSNILNPKVVLFYLAVVPQFIDPVYDNPMTKSLYLSAIHLGISATWQVTLAFVAGKARQWLSSPNAVTWAARLSGLAVVFMGLRLAFAKR